MNESDAVLLSLKLLYNEQENASVQMSDEVCGWQTSEEQQGNLTEDNETETNESTNAESNNWQNGSSNCDSTETGLDTPCNAASEATTQHSILTPLEYQTAVTSADIETVMTTESEGLRSSDEGCSASGFDRVNNDDTDNEPVAALKFNVECGNQQGTEAVNGADGGQCIENGISSENGGLTSLPSDDVEAQDVTLTDQSNPDVEIGTVEAHVAVPQSSSFSAEELLPTETDSAIGDVEQLTSDVEQAGSPSEDRPTSGEPEVVIVSGSESAAVTPMDEYRHLLRQQEDPNTISASEETQPEVLILDVMSSADDSRLDHVSSIENGSHELTAASDDDVVLAPVYTECAQSSNNVTPDVGQDIVSDEVTESSPSIPENDGPAASADAARFTLSLAGDIVHVPQEQQQALMTPTQQNHTSSTADYSTKTSSPEPETNASIQKSLEESPLFQTSSPPVITSTETLTSPMNPSGSTPPIARELTAHQTPSITDEPEVIQPPVQSTRQPQRPPLLPLTIRTDEVHTQSWSPSSMPAFNGRVSFSPSYIYCMLAFISFVFPP